MLWPAFVWAQPEAPVRIATFAAPLSRDGPGLLLRDILRGDDPQIAATIAIINHVDPDVLLLTDIDFDATAVALLALNDRLASPYPYHFTARPNAGVQANLDLDGDGFVGDAVDALGFGRFLGDGGMAVLARWPIDTPAVTDLSMTLWRNVPDAKLPQLDDVLFPSSEVFEVLPVSSTNHWMIPITIGNATISLLAFDATPPVFDGPEDFNGLRNRDELRLWEAVLDGTLGPVPDNPVLIGNANADPNDGEGLREGIWAVLSRPDLQDPQPASRGAEAAANISHQGPPRFDTADWPEDGPGNLRVSYVLPSANLTVTDAGVFWPAPDAPFSDLLGGDGLAAGPHRLVWVDILVEGQ